ncbi:MAG: hypothetical protein KKC46_04025 [Proteobacteria bacterium]|nr:hypothetical protein [Pseudomonadota bacterium]
MKKRMLIFLMLIFLSSVCFADEYVSIMCKDDTLCSHMRKLYNDDLKKYGEIKYDQHEEFNNIKWEKKRAYLINDKGEDEYNYSSLRETMLLSKFDINNDGKIEIVIKSYEFGLRGIPSDQIFIFDKHEENKFKDGIKRNTELYKKILGIIGYNEETSPFRANGYSLKEIPPTQIIPMLGNKKNVPVYNFLGGWFYFNPFIYDNVYYVSMTDWEPHQIDQWLVILRLNPGNQIKDICYFKKNRTKFQKTNQGGEP